MTKTIKPTNPATAKRDRERTDAGQPAGGAHDRPQDPGAQARPLTFGPALLRSV